MYCKWVLELLGRHSSSTAAMAEPTAATGDNSLGRKLFEAAAAGDEPAVEQALEAGADVTWADAEGTTALMTAAENGHQAVVLALLQGGAPWNQQDKEGYCAGEYATASKNQDIMELLMEWGVQAELMLMAAERWAASGGGVGEQKGEEGRPSICMMGLQGVCCSCLHALVVKQGRSRPN